MLIKQSREQSTPAIHVEDFSNLQLCEKTGKSKSRWFENEMKIIKLLLHFPCLTENTF